MNYITIFQGGKDKLSFDQNFFSGGIIPENLARRAHLTPGEAAIPGRHH
jgi:hypothetical protein